MLYKIQNSFMSVSRLTGVQLVVFLRGLKMSQHVVSVE